MSATAQTEELSHNHTAGLIRTKLAMPRVPSGLVARQRLQALLGGSELRPVSLVVAPAGFGKTTLVCQWLTGLNRAIGWVSLDEGDNDELRFWSYVVAAIASVWPGFGGRAATLLGAGQPNVVKSLLPTLINQLAALDEPLVLVLDDYHRIDNDSIHQSLSQLIEHLPPHIHLVLTSRSEPQLPLPRLRVRRGLAEVHDADLRFTEDETADFYHRTMGLRLDEGITHTLRQRTEGWVAALQLAGLSLQGVADVEEFLAEFAGDNRLITDYLTEEILSRQSPAMREFLLTTAQLDRFNAALCDAVLETGGSAALLEQLERAHMFLIPLDQRRGWYRYHHLFSDLLRHQMPKDERYRQIHLRASGWYAANDFVEEAVAHAFRSGDFVAAGQLIDRFGMPTMHTGAVQTLLSWMMALPPDLREVSAHRTLIYAWAKFTATEEPVEPLLSRVERLLTDSPEADDPCLLPQVNLLRGFAAMHQGDSWRAIDLVEEADRMLPRDDTHTHTAPGIILSAAYYAVGDIRRSEQRSGPTIDLSVAHRSLISLTPALTTRTRAIAAAGRLAEADRVFGQSMDFLRERGWDVTADCAFIVMAGADIARHQGRFEAACKLLGEAERIIAEENWETCSGVIMGLQAMTSLHLGDVTTARELAGKLSGLKMQNLLLPVFPSVKQYEVRIAINLGNWALVERWFDQRQLDDDALHDSARETDCLLAARLLLHRGQYEQVIRWLQTVLLAAEEGGRRLAAIETLSLLALGRYRQGDTRRALELLTRAVDQARGEHIVLPFVELIDALSPLLQKLLVKGQDTFIEDLLVHVRVAPRNEVEAQIAAGVDRLAEPLSDKEQQVLKWLVMGLSNREIADHMFVSPNTVKTHLKNVYAKLGVGNRSSAVVKARELDLPG